MQFQLRVALSQELQKGDEFGVPMAAVAAQWKVASGKVQQPAKSRGAAGLSLRH